jgi:hypothetical protein
MKSHLSACVSALAVLFAALLSGAAAWDKHDAGGQRSREMATTENHQNIHSLFTGVVLGLELYNADSNTKVQDLVNNAVVVSPSPPSFNLNAVVGGTGIGSVRFGYGTTVSAHVENEPMYTFCGNQGSDLFKCGTLGYGTHTITVTPFSKAGATGTQGSSFVLTFTIVSFGGQVIKLELMNADTDSKVQDLVDGAVVVTSAPSYNINALVSGSGIGSVRFNRNSVVENVENSAPYAFCGNDGANYYKCTSLGYGVHTVITTPFVLPDGAGAMGIPLVLTFTIAAPMPAPMTDPTNDPPSAPANAPMKAPTNAPMNAPMKAPANAPITPKPTGAVVGLALYSAQTGGKVKDLEDGDIIVSPFRPPFSILANTTGTGIDSVEFSLYSRNTFLGGNSDRSPPFVSGFFSYGEYEISALPRLVEGSLGPGVSRLFFTVVAAAPTKSPTKAEPPMKPPTKAPMKPPTKAPMKPPTKAPMTAPTKAPMKPPTKAPMTAPTKAPMKPPTKAPMKAPTKAPMKAPTKAPMKAPTKAPMKAPTNAPMCVRRLGSGGRDLGIIVCDGLGPFLP